MKDHVTKYTFHAHTCKEALVIWYPLLTDANQLQLQWTCTEECDAQGAKQRCF